MILLRDVMAYICLNYPHKDELSKARLTKMIYLCDWRSAIMRGKQITNIEWIFNHYGPYVDDIYSVASKDPDFEISMSTNIYGNIKEIISVKPEAKTESLKTGDKEIIDFVINKTSTMYWESFIKLVYSTYPIVSQERYIKLNLPSLAEEYKKIAKMYETQL
jgi:hypothetical protein